jgi:polyisoprenoid-binding protein YceI
MLNKSCIVVVFSKTTTDKMKKEALTLIILFVTILPSIAQKKYFADNAATQINWKGGKIVGNSHTGTVDLQSGWLSVEGKTITGGEFVVDMTSIRDSDLKDEGMRSKLESHLKSDDFFGVERFPVSRLIITGGSKFSGGRATVRGDLTIKEATHPVEFSVTESGAGDRKTYTASITFDRSLYNVRYGSGRFFSNLGNNAINDEIQLEITLVVSNAR